MELRLPAVKPVPSLIAIAAALVLTAALGSMPASAAYREPALTVSADRLAAALHCPWEPKKGGKQPVLLVTGTGYTGAEAFLLGSGPLQRLGRPVCYVDFPYRTTGDVQVSAQYLVAAIRAVSSKAGRSIAVFGISQGGLLPRWALTYWPSLRAKVSDVVAVAGTQHGSTIIGPCSLAEPCIPAEWQQLAGSKLLAAINRQPDESPGKTSWTTVRTATDEVVQPQTGPNPTSALKGASNILIQAICPGRTRSHVGSAMDSVTFAAFVDAINHSGPAKVSRLPASVCSQGYAPGTTIFLRKARAAAFEPDPQVRAPLVGMEPPVQPYALKTVPR